MIDVPIGIMDGTPRAVDHAARMVLRHRACCVFSAPYRLMLGARSHEEAGAIRERIDGKRCSRQAFGIFAKIAEVDALMTPADQGRVREGHPEVTFAVMCDGTPMEERMTASNARSGTRNLHINTSVRSCHLAVKRPLRGRVSYDDAEGGGTVVYLGAPIHSGYVLIPRAHLVNVTSLEHEWWKGAPIPALPAEVALDRIPERLGRESCPSSLMRPR